MSAYEGWNDLPTEVLHMVLNKSSEEFCWHLRGVASSWAVAIRSFTKAQLVISAEQDTDHWAGVRQLFQFVQQRAHQYPNACLIIQPRPLVPTACVKFLQGLAEQDYGEVDCTLAIIIDLTGVGLDATTAEEISQAALQLGAVRVSIVHDPAVRLSVRSEVFKELAPVLHKLELHPVATTSASIVGRKPSIKGNCVSLKYSELQQANQSLQTLCVLHWCDGPWTRCRAAIAMHHMVCCIAQLGSLRKLHLTLEDSLTSDVCFAPLAKLSQLQHLALQCQNVGISCADVILSNQATLRSITLDSFSWSPDTYPALNKASALMVLSVRIDDVAESDAEILGNLKTPQSFRLELQKCEYMRWAAMKALSSGQAKITFLSLWGTRVSHWKYLMSMPHLTTLVIDTPTGFTGELVHKQPCLSTLYLVDCNDITEQGVAHIVDIFPALRTVLLCKEDKYSDSRVIYSRMVAQQSMFWTYHSSLSAHSTSTNGLSVQLAFVVGHSSGLQVMCHVQTNSSRRNT